MISSKSSTNNLSLFPQEFKSTQKRLNELPYNKIYHLFLIITTTKGKVILEKTELINMKKYSKRTSDTET